MPDLSELVLLGQKQEKKYKTMPLLTWDCYMLHFEHMRKIGQDIDGLQKLSAQHQWQCHWPLEDILRQEGKTVVVTDTLQHIVYASSGIYAMTGYFPHEIMGQSPRILQGKDTSTQSRRLIREAIETQQPFEAVILNYRKNGTPYQCQIEGHPVFNKRSELTHFMAFEQEV